MTDRITIFDTTLRDGEQSPGAALNLEEKVEIARLLTKLGVDVIEAGFPVSSPVQFEAVQRIAEVSDVIIAGLARTKENDIKAAADALKDAEKPRIHTFVGTSDIHIMEKFRDASYGNTLAEKRATILKMTTDAVAYAKTFVDDVEFSAEDAGRTEDDYLAEVIAAAIAAGATTVNIPDTTGYTMPSEFGEKIARLKRSVPGIENVIISAHCHDDLGLAVANSLAAVQNGARQVECTINGIGERAGNASLEEIVMALKIREDYWGYQTGIAAAELYNTSRMVSVFTGLVVQPNKAIVGENAFAHESGIHQDGMLKSRATYEIISPESVGVTETRIVLGRHSGRAGLKARLEELGYSPSAEDIKTLYAKFVDLADKKKEVYDEDLRVLMGDNVTQRQERYRLEAYHVSAGTQDMSTGTVRILHDDEIIAESAIGDGPVDACFKAIERAVGMRTHLESYRVRSVTEGKAAQGEVNVRLGYNDRHYTGRGISTDIIEAGLKAYLNALNEISKAAEMSGLELEMQ